MAGKSCLWADDVGARDESQGRVAFTCGTAHCIKGMAPQPAELLSSRNRAILKRV